MAPMRALSVLLLSSFTLWAVPAMAGEFKECREVFLSPVFLASHAGTGGEVQVGDAPPATIDIRAKVEGQPDSTEVSIGPPDLAGDIAVIGPLWPEKGAPGRWMPAHVGDTLDVRVLGHPARKETVLGKFRLHLGKVLEEDGYALFSVTDDKVFALHVWVAAADGTRACQGMTGHARPQLTMPTSVVKARPAKAMLETISRVNRCVGAAVTPECDLARYAAEYRDVNGDKKVDAIVWWTAPDGRRIATEIWMRDASGELAPVYLGSCEGDLDLVGTDVVRCTKGDHPTVIDFHHGRGKLRSPTPSEDRAAARLIAADMEQEVEGNLRAIYLAETSFHERWQHYSEDWADLAYLPERGNFYSYFLGEQGARQRRDGTEVQSPEKFSVVEGDTHANPQLVLPPSGPLGCELPPAHGKASPPVHPGVSGDAFVATAVVDLNGAGLLDCWSVSSKDRVAADGTKVEAGEPFHHEGVRVGAQ
jgi:hypothetical protein